MSTSRHSLNQDSWNCFLSTSAAEPEHHQIRTSWTDFVDFWNNARKNAMKIPGNDFLDFCNEGQKIIKSGLLGLILPTSGANTRKASNQDSWDGLLYFCSQTRTSCNPDFWDWFCRLLHQHQKVIKSAVLGLISWILQPRPRKDNSCSLSNPKDWACGRNKHAQALHSVLQKRAAGKKTVFAPIPGYDVCVAPTSAFWQRFDGWS